MTSDSDFSEIDHAMEGAVAEGVFPAGVLLFAWKESVLYHRGFGFSDMEKRQPAGPETVFDLASLTKPLATAPAVAILIKEGRVGLGTPLEEILAETRGTAKAGITVDMLLRHTSGLPAHREYFKGIPDQGRESARRILRQMLLAEPLEAPPGKRECYSDLGYMMLSWVVERLSSCDLHRFVKKRIYAPLGIDRLGFVPLDRPVPVWCRHAAPTMNCPWRNRIIRAEVEDENAWAAGGVEGHAGLFGTASAVYRICCELMAAATGSETKVLDSQVMTAFLKRRPGMTRVAGFDRPSGPAPAAGTGATATTIGHLGFTGTSFWMDPQSGLLTILLTNRVHPSRENLKIRKFRPLVHDLVFKAFKRIIPV